MQEHQATQVCIQNLLSKWRLGLFLLVNIEVKSLCCTWDILFNFDHVIKVFFVCFTFDALIIKRSKTDNKIIKYMFFLFFYVWGPKSFVLRV